MLSALNSFASLIEFFYITQYLNDFLVYVLEKHNLMRKVEFISIASFIKNGA